MWYPSGWYEAKGCQKNTFDDPLIVTGGVEEFPHTYTFNYSPKRQPNYVAVPTF